MKYTLQLIYNVEHQGEFGPSVQSVEAAIQLFLAHRDGELYQPFSANELLATPVVIDVTNCVIVAQINYDGTVQRPRNAQESDVIRRLREPPTKDEVEITTRWFQRQHCEKPRGEGYWAFSIGRDTGRFPLFWFNGSYHDAVEAAKKKACETGHRFIQVDSVIRKASFGQSEQAR